jgi:hypothetical protein
MKQEMKHDLMQLVLEAVLAVGAGMSWWMVGNLILRDVIDLAAHVMREARLQG